MNSTENDHFMHVLGQPYNGKLVQQVVNSYIQIGHKGSKKQKNRAEVSGGNSKPWPQKGKGRSRCGSIRNCIFRKGGLAFPARGVPKVPHKVNKKMYHGALVCILSKMYKDGLIHTVPEMVMSTYSTSTLQRKLYDITETNSRQYITLMIDSDDESDTLHKSANNIPNLNVVHVKSSINLVYLLKSRKIVMTARALEFLNTQYSSKSQ